MAASARRRACAWLLGSTLALVAGCETPTVAGEPPAYDPIAITNLVYHWPVGRPIAVYVDPTGSPAGVDLGAVVAEASRRWMDAVYYREVGIVQVRSPGAADLIVHFAHVPRLVAEQAVCPFLPGGSGYTHICIDPVSDDATGEILGAVGDSALTLPLLSGAPSRVKLDIRVDAASAADPDRFLSLVAHELGHALGLGTHSDEPSDLMFPGPTVTRPSPRDAQTLRFVLHRPADFRL